jgi:hypothetical protein
VELSFNPQGFPERDTFANFPGTVTGSLTVLGAKKFIKNVNVLQRLRYYTRTRILQMERRITTPIT